MSHITQVGTVFVPVADQDAAVEFYVGTLGFEQTGDWPYGGGHRWVEVAPPGSVVRLALVPPSEGASAGGDVVRCALSTDDIDADHAALLAAGVDIDPVVAREGNVWPDGRSPGSWCPESRFRDIGHQEPGVATDRGQKIFLVRGVARAGARAGARATPSRAGVGGRRRG